ncbi:MAG: permease [Gemmatimonadetes bacterium]|nr:permease [Gemmatimonadota bacterium]
MSRRAWSFWQPPVEQEVDEELASHLALQVQRFMRDGMDEASAREAAARRFGNHDAVSEEGYAVRRQMREDARRAALRHDLRQDVHFALRMFRTSPLFPLVAILTIAIGAGASTAIFSVARAVLLRPLPYANADRVLALWNGYGDGKHYALSPDEMADVREQLHAADDVAGMSDQATTLLAPGAEPERVTAYLVTPNLFSLLGASAAIGRTFGKGEGAAGDARTVVLGHDLWRRRFGGDRGVLGRELTIGGLPRTVIGVMPEGVRFPDAPLQGFRAAPDLWLPAQWPSPWKNGRGDQMLAVVARLRPGVTHDALAREVAAIGKRFNVAFPARYAPPAVPTWQLEAVSLRQEMVGEYRPALALLAGSVLLVLLIACVNVGNLLLARGDTRRRELAVRLALGASRGRLVRQLLTETTLLTCAGAFVGAGLAYVALPSLIALDGGHIPLLDRAQVDGEALAFAVMIALVSGALVGMMPALRQSRGDLRGAANDGARGATRGRASRGVRRGLLAGQVAMAVIVLVAAGLLARSFRALQRVDAGFDGRNVLSMSVAIPRTRYDSAQKVASFYEHTQQRLAATPGVVLSSGVYPLPLGGDVWSGTFTVEGAPSGPAIPLPHASYAVALPNYFRAIGIALQSGRDFSSADVATSPAVVIVDELLARQHWPGVSALGKRLNPNGNPGQWATVIGVVAHVRSHELASEGEGQLYLPFAQDPQRLLTLVLRAQSAPASLVPGARLAIRRVDADVPLTQVRTMDELLASATARPRFNMLLMSLFAVVALGLASLGLYGVMSFLVAQRGREIGIRMALGAPATAVRRMIVRESATIALAGLAVGALAALALSRTMGSLLYGVPATDPLTFVASAAIVLAVALLAAWIPATRAARQDPLVALRA